jgi:hypothetical protein
MQLQQELLMNLSGMFIRRQHNCSLPEGLIDYPQWDSRMRTSQTSGASSITRPLRIIWISISRRRKNVSQASLSPHSSANPTSPPDEEHARALEEQWIDSIDNAGSASLSQSSPSNSTVLQGVLLGFFFPLIPFFFMRNSKPAVFWDDGSDYEPPANVIFSSVFLIYSCPDITLKIMREQKTDANGPGSGISYQPSLRHVAIPFGFFLRT